MLINLKFMSEWQDKMLSGRKTCTCRTSKNGNVGDNFVVFNTKFIITDIQRRMLGAVVLFYKEEGCDTLEEFKQIWIKLHPIMGYNPERKVYFHFFRKETNG